MMVMAVININYDEPNQDSYKSINYNDNYNNTEHVFDTGDFVKDWYDLIKHIIHNPNPYPIIYSSSVDHFIMDGDKYKGCYLLVDDESAILSYDKKYQGVKIELFMFSDKEMTWKELIEYCEKK